MNYLPSKLLKLRKHYNYSQAHIAEVLGIDVVEYMAIENGRKVLNYNQCKKIANLYHIGVIDIFKNSDEVTLYEVSRAKTDELNIEYFLPEKTLKDKILLFIKRNPVLVGITSGIVILGVIALAMFGGKIDEPYVATFKDINRLATSQTTVVYISNDGTVKGSGDNSNGQLSNLPSNGVIKVGEGSSFTIVLHDDGTVSGIGLLSKYQEEIDAWKNIVDVACGDNHIVAVDIKGNVYAVGDNTYGQCDIEDFSNIKDVYATHNGTILIDKDGKLYNCGEFIGSSQIKNFNNIIDIDTSNDNLVLVTSDNKVDYITKSMNFLDIYKWKDIVNVACGDEFVAALTKDGKVLLDSNDQSMQNEVSEFENIIAIDAGDDYLIAFDGQKIYGAGKNNYHQFEKAEVEKSTLPQVSGVKVSIGNTIDVSFDKVLNAVGYEVKLELDNPIVYKVSSNQTVSFISDNLEDGKNYKITITTLGDGLDYLDSLPLDVDFTFSKEEVIDGYVDIDKDFEGMSVTDFLSYIKSIGVPDTGIIGVENGSVCQGNSETIISVDGISKGQRIYRNELKNAKVTYNYCRINNEPIGDLEDE